MARQLYARTAEGIVDRAPAPRIVPECFVVRQQEAEAVIGDSRTLQRFNKLNICTKRIHGFGMLPIERNLELDGCLFVASCDQEIQILLWLEGRSVQPRHRKRPLEFHLEAIATKGVSEFELHRPFIVYRPSIRSGIIEVSFQPIFDHGASTVSTAFAEVFG